MVNENLKEFMDKIKYEDKDIAYYVDEEKGTCFPIALTNLYPSITKLELEKGNKTQAGALERAKYEQKIENKDYKIVDIDKLVSKYEITKIEADKLTLTTKRVKGAIVWNVTNGLGIHSTYEDKKEALDLWESIRNEVLKHR